MKRTIFLIMLLPSLLYSQTSEDRKRIAAQSNHTNNATLLKELKNKEERREFRIVDYLHQNPTKRAIIQDDEFGKKEIRDILSDGNPMYYSTYNEGAAITARSNSLYSGGALGINIQGQGMTAGVWDGGSVRDTHQEFLVGGFSKVTIMDGSANSNHGTHVAGTIAARGALSIPITGGTTTVRGVAFNSSIISYDWNNDLTEMLNEASNGLLVSNHSYGPSLSANSQLWFLGAYVSDALQVDAICFNNPFYLPVFAAGNNRNDTTIPYSTHISNKSGYDLLAGEAVAKNVLTVAAVNNVPNYLDESSVSMSAFSNWGPTDDGRIKPDISTKGVNVRSTLSNSDTATGFMSGTSMAAPGITGVVTLLQQYHNQLYNNYMRSATVKGLILHTADEAGYNIGPDYEYGWGLVNTDSAAKLIRDKNLTSNRSIIEERSLNSGGSYSKTIVANGTTPLKVSISWTDPAFPTANNGISDPSTSYLVNDLDVKVTSSNGTVYYPWKGPGIISPSSPATNNSTNNVDNFERVDIPNPTGTYTISVTHKGSITGGQQNYSLIVSSSNMSSLNVNEALNKKSQVSIYPNPATNALFVKNYKKGSKVSILDFSGRILYQDIIENDKISLSNLQSGNYLLIYIGDDGIEKTFSFSKN